MIRNGIWILLVWGLVVAAACSQMRKPDTQARARKRPMLAYPGPTRLPADYMDNLRRSSEYQHGGVARPKVSKAAPKVAKKSSRTVTKKMAKRAGKKQVRKASKPKARRMRKTASLHKPTAIGTPSGLVKE